MLHSTHDNWVYVQYPVQGFCCQCTQNIGAVRYDWARDASYEGRVAVDAYKADFPPGVSEADGWLKYGASDNHFYCTTDGTQRPIRYMEHKNGKLKQWDLSSRHSRHGTTGWPRHQASLRRRRIAPPAAAAPCAASEWSGVFAQTGSGVGRPLCAEIGLRTGGRPVGVEQKRDATVNTTQHRATSYYMTVRNRSP